MGYAYEDLDDAQFERLVVEVMRSYFGIGVESFAPGPDGGRDARFRGTAERFPSARGPWRGTTIGQAKHTNAINAHVHDPEFSSAKDGSVISKEIPRIRRLAASGELDNYVIFTNRRVGAISGTAIIERIVRETGISATRCFIAGTEYLDDILHYEPDVLRRARISPVDAPLVVSSQDLAEVILAIAEALAAPDPLEDSPVVERRWSMNDKNELNGMTPEFARLLNRRYMSLTKSIEDFLARPANSGVLRRYEAAADDFEMKIVAHRHDYQSFDRVYNYLVDLLFKRDGVLAAHRKLTRALVFYMYWHCDIGESPNAAS